MNKLNGYTSTPKWRSPYQEKEEIDGSINFFTTVNGYREGQGKAIYPEHTIKYTYVNNMKQGGATISHLDQTRILFTYVNDLPDGPATVIYPDGTRGQFRYVQGEAQH